MIIRACIVNLLLHYLFFYGVSLAAIDDTTHEPEFRSSKEVIRFLENKGPTLSNEELERVCRFRELKTLDLSHCQQITDAGLEHVTKLQHLETLNLDGCHRISVIGIKHISGIPSLTELDISQSRLNLPDVMSELARLPNLRKLEIRNVRGLNTRGLEHFTQLHYLDLSTSHGGINDDNLRNLAPLKELRFLNLNGSRNWGANKALTDEGLAHLEGLSKLEFLGLFGHFNLTESAYNSLFKNLVSLKRLEMGFNWPLKGTGLAVPESLEELNLMESFQLKDQAVQNLTRHHGLKKLNLFYCLELTNQCLQPVRTMKGLESLHLGSIAGLSDEALKMIQVNTSLSLIHI